MTAIEMMIITARETWNKIYALINWKNRPSTATALGATNLNKMDVAINTLDNRVIQLKAEKLGLDVANLMISSWVMDMQTYKITVTQLNGTVKEYDLNLERIPLKVSLSEEGILTFTYADGTNDSVNVADLIKDTVYEESDTITFEKNFASDIYHVTASIKNNSIEERHLKTDVMQDIRNNANIAQTAANESLTYSKDSKRWAVGDGEYEGSEVDNSKYYKEEAEKAKVAAEKARDEAQAATGSVIMAPGVLGVGMPDNTTIKVTEDGTMSVPKATSDLYGLAKPDNVTIGQEDGVFRLIAKAASLPVTDTQGLVGDKGAETNTQILIDAIADKKVDKSGGDIADTKVASLEASAAQYPVLAAGDTTKIAFGKVKKFFEDIRNWMTGVCLIGQIVNNCVTNRADLPLSAAQGKVLMDLYNVLNAKHKNNLGKDSALIPNLIWLPEEYIDNPNGYAGVSGWNVFVYVSLCNISGWSLVLGIYDNGDGNSFGRQLAVGTTRISQRSFSNGVWSAWSNL